MMKKKGPYEVISMQSCMDWCNKFETCSYFSFQKIEKLCFLFEVRYSRPHGKTKGETSGPRWCTEMKMMETPVQNNKSKIWKSEHFWNSNVNSINNIFDDLLVSFWSKYQDLEVHLDWMTDLKKRFPHFVKVMKKVFYTCQRIVEYNI